MVVQLQGGRALQFSSISSELISHNFSKMQGLRALHGGAPAGGFGGVVDWRKMHSAYHACSRFPSPFLRVSLLLRPFLLWPAAPCHTK